MKRIFKNPVTTIIGVIVIAVKLISLRGKISADEANTIISGLSGLGLITAADGHTKKDDE
jgi:hypothetical protein